jgi:hypothetical protein
MRVRFWGEITRGVEKWVKLSLGHFLSCINHRLRAPFTPKPGRIAQSLRFISVVCELIEKYMLFI